MAGKPLKRKVSRTMVRRPFRIFEGGPGERPVGLIAKAAKSAREGQAQRIFTGAEEHGFEVNQEVLKRAKAGAIPKNLRLVEDCAVHALLKLPAESQSIVFESYLTNNLDSPSACYPGISCEQAFFEAADQALKPGGRLIAVQDLSTVGWHKEIARHMGYGFHAIPLSDEKALKSKSKAIRVRATPKRRLAELNRIFSETSILGRREREKRMRQAIKRGEYKTREDSVRPTLMVFRKPRKRERQNFSEPIVISINASQMPSEMRSIIEQILKGL